MEEKRPRSGSMESYRRRSRIPWRAQALDDDVPWTICQRCLGGVETLLGRNRGGENVWHYGTVESLRQSVRRKAPCRLCFMIWDSSASVSSTAYDGSLSYKKTGRRSRRFRLAECPPNARIVLSVGNFDHPGWSYYSNEPIREIVVSVDDVSHAFRPALYRPKAIGSLAVYTTDASKAKNMNIKLLDQAEHTRLPRWSLRADGQSIKAPTADAIGIKPVEEALDQVRLPLGKLKAWLTSCQLHHHRTCSSVAVRKMPSRLLDISQATAEKPNSIRLVSFPRDDTQYSPYAALSYCWGEDPFLATTTKNFTAHKDSIELQCCPLTIQQAVAVARHLGLQYLWVDALCILQGDNPAARLDWMRESTAMASVYGNAFVTIMAGHGICPHTGFLNFPGRREWVLVQSGESSESQFFLGPAHPKRAKEALNQRAWALQEAFLSRRIIFFGSTEVFWACNGGSAGQCDPTSDYMTGQIQEHEEQRPTATRNHAGLRVLGIPLCDSFSGPSSWEDIVEDLTRRKMTFKNDTLPALSGLAAQYRMKFGHVYLAGIWKEDIWGQLLWHGHQDPVAFEGEYVEECIPSWSWASADGPVTFYSNHIAIDCILVNYDIEVADGSTLFGRLKKAILTLSGEVIAVPKASENSRLSIFGRYSVICTRVEKPGEWRPPPTPLAYVKPRKNGFTDHQGRAEPSSFPPGSFLLLLGRNRQTMACGLILEKLDKKGFLYRRIGMFNNWPLFDGRLKSEIKVVSIV